MRDTTILPIDEIIPSLRAALSFQTGVFVFFLLPVILLAGGYTLETRAMAANLGSVLVFAFLGTIMSTLGIAGVLYGAGRAGLSSSTQAL